MSIVLQPDALDAVIEVARQILGADHPLVGRITDVRLDPDNAHLVWSEIEGLPAAQRKALAAMVAAVIMPALKPDSDTHH